jgi:hypothetical protein
LDTDAPISDEEFSRGLAEVLGSLMARAHAERTASEPWNALWQASEGGLEGLLSEAERRTSDVLMSLSDVINERFGIARTSPRLHDLIRALPFALRELQEGISREHGFSCCGDKARFVYAQAVLDEINRIKSQEA